MSFINIKIKNYLYIFFIILVSFFTEFSTNFALSKSYNISNVKLEETYNLNFDRTKVIEYGFEKAFYILVYKLIEKKDRIKFEKTSLQEIKALINTFSVSEEKFLNDKYKSLLDVDFNKNKFYKFIQNNNVKPSIPEEINTLIIPIFVNRFNNEMYYLNGNKFYEKWNKNLKNYFLIKYHFPNEDIEDYILIKNKINDIENYKFEEIIKKYNFDNNIILTVFIDKNKINIFSRFSLKDNEFLLNKKIESFNKKNDKDFEKVILDIQEAYEDILKSQNKINTSIKININLEINSSNYNTSQKLENILSDFELIYDYEIKSIDNKNITYSITYNGLPENLYKYLTNKGFVINNSKEIWNIK
tara:strand:- start:234 stop:1310 length:1077 start_codon:yes stop_codon:yes gene_type:complete